SIRRGGYRLTGPQGCEPSVVAMSPHCDLQPPTFPIESVTTEVERHAEESLVDTRQVGDWASRDSATTTAAGHSEDHESQIINSRDRDTTGIKAPLVRKCGTLGQTIQRVEKRTECDSQYKKVSFHGSVV